MAKITAKSTTLTLDEAATLKTNPHQPRPVGDVYDLAMLIADRGQDNAVIISRFLGDDCVNDVGETVKTGDLVTVQGHRRIAATFEGVSLGWLPATFAIRCRYVEYETDAEQAKAVGDQSSSVGLENKWELFKVVKPLLALCKGGGQTHGSIALTHNNTYSKVWNVVDEKRNAINAKIRLAKMAFANGDTIAAEECLKEAAKIAEEYRRGATQTYVGLAQLPDDVYEYMRRQWVEGLAEGEPQLSLTDMNILKKAFAALECHRLEPSKEWEGIFAAHLQAKIDEKDKKKKKADKDKGKAKTIMSRKDLERCIASAGCRETLHLMKAILNADTSALKEADAHITAQLSK